MVRRAKQLSFADREAGLPVSKGARKLRRQPEAHLDWGMKTPDWRFCFNFVVRMR
jgi:hypothetical protein